MDLRVERTKRSIVNAFLELRSKKVIEKITIKELAERAGINKATFYSHYQDIYDLSEQLENEVIEQILMNIPSPEEFITKPKEAVEILANAFFSQNTLIDILFEKNRFTHLVVKIEEGIKNKIYKVYPEYKNNMEWNVILTYSIQGSFHAFLAYYKKMDNKKLIEMIGNMNERVIREETQFL